MIINMTEKWLYYEYSVYSAETLPDNWDELSTSEKYAWTVDNAEYVGMDNNPDDLVEVLDVEAY